MELLDNALSWFNGVLWGVFDDLAGFVLGMFPDSDSLVVNNIKSMVYILNGHDLDFNLYYFLDMEIVVVFLSIWAAVTIASVLVMAVRFVLDIVHKVLDSIPVVG